VPSQTDEVWTFNIPEDRHNDEVADDLNTTLAEMGIQVKDIRAVYVVGSSSTVTVVVP